ncbi:polysaccharide pyruvyl transferase family protein [Roseburia inulinivorans]|uniref:Ferredoxin I n=1 Tax=Roseburia inulinivorans TaxID=360807 RepID=A0A173R1X7_9FIRM|nr:polysaccharide pyruvyl transferase family protein [Roseburia inulinivorans]CUM72004.1 Ferredoxin I [Roseburia inulinivorans]
MEEKKMSRTIEIVGREECTGCGACFNLCPLNAIKMTLDNNGFLQPVINKEICIDCGMCLKKCPVINSKYVNSEKPICYAVSASDEVKKNSSSGGVFKVLADYQIENCNGYVCGAVMMDNNVDVEQMVFGEKDKIALMQGSKYVQSFTNKTFQKTEQLLQEGKKVLYTGTPCQIAGLYAYLSKNYDNLVTAELICHGVPSKKVLQKYIEEVTEKYGEISKISFRTKELDPEGGWSRSVTAKIVLKNGTIYYNERTKDVYLKAFLKALSMNSACKNCKFQRLPRQADLTMGDFWGIEKVDNEMFDPKGTSVVLINNNHGKEYFDMVKERFIRIKEETLESAINGNRQIVEAPWVNQRRDRFYSLLDKYTFSKAVDYGLNRRFDIGYVGWWYGANYGSVLTNFALHEVLTKKLGKTVLMISYPGVINPIIESKSMRFAKKHYEISMPRKIDAHEDLNYYCEKFVLGSDQLWNWYSIKDTGNHFLLDWVKKDKNKIAYATSFGHNKSFFPQDERIEVARLFHEFNAISVREKEGVDILRNEFGVNALQLIDPVFLCEKEIYDVVADEVPGLSDEDYFYAYILDPTDEKREAVEFIKRKLNMKALIVIDGQAENKDELVKIMGEQNVYSEVSIEQWLKLIKDAKFVFTDSYHGTCFSIINKKPFISMRNRKRGNSRFDSLMNMLHLQDRMISNPTDISLLDDSIYEMNSIDYKFVYKVLEQEKEKGMNWLRKNLEIERKNEDFYSIILNKIKEQEQEIKKLKHCTEIE